MFKRVFVGIFLGVGLKNKINSPQAHPLPLATCLDKTTLTNII